VRCCGRELSGRIETHDDEDEGENKLSQSQAEPDFRAREKLEPC
jgi:hypothetical protein